MPGISKAKYDAMLESHRDAPGNVSAAARRAGVSRATASKYWQHGGDEAWMLPLRSVISKEQVAARAVLERERIEAARLHGQELGMREAIDASADAGRELAETAKLAREAKGNALDLLGIIKCLTSGAKTIERELAAAFDDGTIRELVKAKPSEAIKLVRELARLVHDGNLAAETAVKLEAHLLGDGPGGDTHVHVESVDDAHEIIERAARAARRRRGERPAEPESSAELH